MTQRFFYTDALAAAWQAKHHGFRFQNINNGADFGLPDLLIHAGTGNFCHINIHPESYGLLEPQVGDLLHDTKRKTFGIMPKTNSTRLNYYSKTLMPRGWIRIIQRNGIQFMWPESESA